MTDKAVYRDVDDPNVVLVMHRFESREQGEKFMNHPDLIAAQKQSGVELDSVRMEVTEA